MGIQEGTIATEGERGGGGGKAERAGECAFGGEVEVGRTGQVSLGFGIA